MKTVRQLFLIFICLSFTQLKLPAVIPPPDGGYPGGNTAEGQNALFSLSSGGYNTAVGFLSLRSNATNNFNTAIGAGALFANGGDYNTAVGAAALLSNTTGFQNTAVGTLALLSNTTGGGDTAVGFGALSNNTASNNTAMGNFALNANTSGHENTAFGASALAFNQDGSLNTAIGTFALPNNHTGTSNTAIGSNALFSNTTGIDNAAVGGDALLNNTNGNNNIALGSQAGLNLTTGNYNIDIGNAGVAGETGTIRIGDDNFNGATFIAGIYSVPVAGLAVAMDSSGHLGTVGSSRRFKKEIRPMARASEAILALKPVTFRYKAEIDPAETAQFGLVAEEVEKVSPDLVVKDKEGKPYTVRYDQVNAMLLNEFLKEHAKVQQLKEDFESRIAEQQKQIEALTAGLQKVSAQLDLNKPAPQTALNYERE
jgi:hypothetical protein